MKENNIARLRDAVYDVRDSAVAARIKGNHLEAECLTGKAVGMKAALSLAQRALEDDPAAKGELQGFEDVLELLKPIPKCK